MTETRFYQLSAALPIALPFLLGLPLLAIDAHGDRVFEIAFLFVGYLFYAALVGGVPYCIVAGISLRRLRQAPASAYRRFSLRLPWLYAGFFWLCFTVIQLATGSFDGETFEAGGLFTGLAVLTAWFYVGLVHALRRVLARLGAVRG